jgi:hypothetical protein
MLISKHIPEYIETVCNSEQRSEGIQKKENEIIQKAIKHMLISKQGIAR